MSILLRTAGLTVSYAGLRAVDGVSLVVPQGSVVALLGPNGAGKSSMLSAIAGLAPRSGEVWFDEERIDRDPGYRIAQRGVCFIPEQRGVFPGLSVDDNLRLAAPPGDPTFTARVLDEMPALQLRRRTPAGSLSGGEQQMLSLARAIAGRPRLLMLDEPSLGLAPKLVDRLYQTISSLKQVDATVLLVEQHAHRALDVADVLYVMAHGRIVFAGQPAELPHAPALIERYIGAVPN